MGKRLIKAPNGETAFRCCGKTFKRHQDFLQHKTRTHKKNTGRHYELFKYDDIIETKAEQPQPPFPELMNIMAPPDDKTTFESGATSSKKLPRYDLIPRVMLETLAARITLGAEKHGDFNYRKGFHDKAFIIDRINHLVEHFNALLCPRTKEEWDDDNIGAILWAAMFLAEVRQADPLLLDQIRRERAGLA